MTASSIEVSFSISEDTVTSVDTGAPIGSFEADGTQTDSNYEPYPVGTLLHKDETGYPQVVIDNSSHMPILTLNSSQTWALIQEPLRRESLIFNKPTQYGRFHQPVNWVPSSRISEIWGTLQLIVAGQDVTYFRSHPTEMGSWSNNEPNGDAACSIVFPQISWFERPAHGELAWIRDGQDVNIILIRPNGTRKSLFEGMLVGLNLEGSQGIGISLNVLGVLYQADHSPYIQELYKKNRDIGSAIADIMDGSMSRQFLPCNRPVTGIRTNIRGSGGARLTQGVQDLLSTAFTADAQNQWTITNLPGRKPHIKLKDRTTRHWTMAIGHPGLKLNIANDWQQLVGMVYGSGIANDGASWFNAKYPGTRIDTVPPYPLPVGMSFVTGDAVLYGFDVFADELRSRGYSMQSRDTYSSSDVNEVKDAQRRAGITVDGRVGAQTWTALFGVGGSVPSPEGAHIAPLAAVSGIMPNLERPDGSIIGPNPKYEKHRLAIGRLVEYGEGVSKADGVKFARGEIQARINWDPQWVGSATLTMDPENGSRWEMRAGENIFFKFMYAPLRRVGIDDGLLLHISQVTVNPGGDVSLQVSLLAHDMTTLSALKNRNKDTLDPARRGSQGRISKISKDNIVPWDSEAGGGKIPLHNLQGGFWTVIRIPAGQIGTIVQTNFVCATSLGVNTLSSAFKSQGVLSGAKSFCIAIFGRPITSNYLKGLIGNPLTTESVWSNKAPELERAGLMQAYGASDQPAGYWPGQSSGESPLTGKLMDGSSWTWESLQPPYLWIAEYCASSTRIAGQLRNAPLGS